MSQVLTIKLPDDMQQKLQERADKFSISLESLVLKLLLQALNSDDVFNDYQDDHLSDTNLEKIDPIVPLIGTITLDAMDDPLEEFIGGFSSDVSDWCDRHDDYLGRAAMHMVSKEVNV